NYDSSAIDDEDFSFWDAGLNYKLSEALTLDASYKVDFVESVSTGTYKSKRYEGSLSYSKFITSTLSAFHSKSEYLEENREDKSTGISLDLTMPVTEKLSGTITGTYTKYTFKPEDTKDKRYSLRLALNYELKITTLSIGYTYNKNNSTDDTKDYKNNIIWAQARITF
ncbi:MAG: TIGR03016 family PEP-CTERM system-associated outer membrane protein, partial [Nitrospirae bacterium]